MSGRFVKGHVSHNKGKIFSKELREKLSLVHKGKKASPETRAKMRIAHLGKQYSIETREKLRKSVENYNQTEEGIAKRLRLSQERKGDKSHRWKGGVTTTNQIIRNSVEYKLWRESVFKRDKYTCIWCGSKKDLNADHIKRFADFPELRFAIDNGRTLCAPCHRTTDTWGNRS